MLSQQTLEGFVSRGRGIGHLIDALSFSAGDRLIRVFFQFLEYSAVFPGCISALAAKVTLAKGLFIDRKQVVKNFNCASTRIGAKIIAPNFDEFGDPANPKKLNHPELATRWLKNLGKFFGRSQQQLDKLAIPTAETKLVVKKSQDGYGVHGKADARGIFRALGFHLLSERLALEEFRAIRQYCVSNSALEHYLQETKVQHYVHMHCAVEEDHAAMTFDAVNDALRYYAGPESGRHLRQWVVEGFKHCNHVHERFMGSLVPISRSFVLWL